MELERLVQNAKEFGRKAIVSGMIVASGILSHGCGKDKIEGPFGDSNKYLYFGVASGAHPREGRDFGVRVYDQDMHKIQFTREIQPLGQALPNGNFYITNKLDASRKYRIEIYGGENKSCYKTLGEISQESTPYFWTDYDFSKARKTTSATTPLPPEPPTWRVIYLDPTLTPIQGCWGDN